MSNTTTPTPKISKKVAMDALWRQGVLVWKLKKHQKDLYDLFYNTPHRINTWLLSRRSGKTFTLCLLAVEACLKNKNTIVKFVAPTKLQINTILRPLMKEVLDPCPEDIKPSFSTKDYVYYFPNGSEIQLAGSESQHYQKLRGGSSNIAIVDEAHDVSDLKDVINSVLLPTTLTTKGKIILSGTPPKNPDHDFAKFIEEAQSRKSIVVKTIYDNVMLTPEDIKELEVEMGGANSEAFKREALCEIIKDPSSSVIPEFTPELKTEIVKEWKKPVFYDTYESMDLGFHDLTGILFAYYDFKADKVIIEDEYAVNGNEVQIPKLVESIKKKEEELWTNPLTNEIKKPYMRVSDINYIVTHEISRFSNKEINFIAAKKDDKEAAINTLRVMIANKKIIINPRCQQLIEHLDNVKWDKHHKQFARSPMGHHYDLVDALIYLVRHIIYTKNPYPAHYDLNLRPEDTFVYNRQSFESKQKGVNIQNFYKMLNIKPKK